MRERERERERLREREREREREPLPTHPVSRSATRPSRALMSSIRYCRLSDLVAPSLNLSALSTPFFYYFSFAPRLSLSYLFVPSLFFYFPSCSCSRSPIIPSSHLSLIQPGDYVRCLVLRLSPEKSHISVSIKPSRFSKEEQEKVCYLPSSSISFILFVLM